MTKIKRSEFREIADRRGKDDIAALVEHVRDDLGFPEETTDTFEPAESAEAEPTFEPLIVEKAR